jgi:acylphosphatase
MAAKRVVIAGLVQRVGFRDWMVTEATILGVAGWVRNLPDGSVEALVDGATPAVEELLRRCRRGPARARVDSITEEMAEPPDEPGFRRL